ncbi:hypothetical protein JM81_2029 [Maribacter sp. MAR_2009_72]|nr:hypothetical protein JM81_2029 [Maribacter sp. MAR_2009_72]
MFFIININNILSNKIHTFASRTKKQINMKEVIQLNKRNKKPRNQLLKIIFIVAFATFILSFSYVNDKLFLKELSIAIATITIAVVVKEKNTKTGFSRVVNLYDKEKNLDKRKIN